MKTDAAILIVDDDADTRDAFRSALSDGEHEVLGADSHAAALDILKTRNVGLVIANCQLKSDRTRSGSALSDNGLELLRALRHRYPSLPAVVVTAKGSIESAVRVMRRGAVDYLVKPVDTDVLKQVVSRHLSAGIAAGDPIAADPTTTALIQIAQRVAATNVTVTISGPSGSGKEVFARFIHACSPRAQRPFVAINCAAIPESMLEAVLFGHEKGAFTGANNAHPGKFEQANGGTLLLDEVSEMALGLQAKLLRVLQEKEVERIGGKKTIALDVRVLATTNRDLRQYVADGRFREDLYYRLNVFPLHVPPLCERRGDILPLAELSLRRFGSAGIALTDAAKEALLQHNWPGNVRELENLMQRSLILLTEKHLDVKDLAFESPPSPGGADLSEGLKSHEYQLIVDALSAHAGKRAEVARALGISARSLRYKLAAMRADGVEIPGEAQ